MSKENEDFQACQFVDLKDHQGLRDLLVHQGLEDQLDLLGKDTEDLRDHKDLKGLKDLEVLRDLKVLRVHLETRWIGAREGLLLSNFSVVLRSWLV